MKKLSSEKTDKAPSGQMFGFLNNLDPAIATLLKGILVGGGGAALLGYMSKLNDEERKKNLYAGSDFDDDTIYIKPKNAADSEYTVPKNVNRILGGTLSAAGGYWLIREMLNDIKKKRLQEELDEAQYVYYDTLLQNQKLKKSGSETVVYPNMNDSTTDALVRRHGLSFNTSRLNVPSVGFSALALLALLTAAATPKVLSKYSPDPKKKPEKPSPKRVVVAEDPLEKQASSVATELMLRSVYGDKERSSINGIGALVNSVASGNIQDIRDVIEHGGVDACLDICKNANYEIPSDKLSLAFYQIARDPIISEALSPVLASEVYDMSPSLVKIASNLTDEQYDNLLVLGDKALGAVREQELSSLFPANDDVFDDFVKRSYATDFKVSVLIDKLLSL